MATFAIVGGEGAGKSALGGNLGKKGTDTDLTFFNFAKGDAVRTYVDPKGYPAALKPLVQALDLADAALLCVPSTGPTARTGECVVALDLLGKEHGALVITMADRSNPQALSELAAKLGAMTRGTAIEGWRALPVSTTTFAGLEELRSHLAELDAAAVEASRERSGGLARVTVDHVFNVTGVGCVALGMVNEGTLNQRDAFTVFPARHSAEVRSIQCNDADVRSAPAGSRVGLALKGVRDKDLERGSILSTGEEVSDKLRLECRLTPFCQGAARGETLHVFVGLQSSPAAVEAVEVDGSLADKARPGSDCTLSLALQKALAFRPRDRFLVAQLSDPKQRLVAGGWAAVER